jgi:hypothetical protein
MRQFDFNSPLLDSPRQRRDLVASRSEPAIIGFAAFSLLGAIAMSYYCRMGLDAGSAGPPRRPDVPIYETRAVPADEIRRPLGAGEPSRAAQPAGDNSESIVNDGKRTHPVRPDEVHATNTAAVERDGTPLYSFPEFETLERAAMLGSASAVAGRVASQSGSANIEAPDAAFASFAPVPEPNAWSFAGGFALFLCAGERLRRRRTRHF